MDDRKVYGKDETARMLAERRAVGTVTCPRCAVRMFLAKDVTPTPTVSYVRHREWWRCPTCGWNVVFDP